MINLQVSYTDSVVLLPQARELLVLLKESGYRLALATMSARDVVDQISSYHGIEGYFEHVMTADDVIHGKPELFGGRVKHTLYVGDSSEDLEAAVRLEMPFFDSGIYVRGEARKNAGSLRKRIGIQL